MGPGQPGGLAKGGHDDVEYQQIKAHILELRSQSMTHAEIAALTGYSRPHITKLLKKIMRELLDEAGADEVRVNEVARIEKMQAKLLRQMKLDDDEVPVSLHSVDRFIKLSNLKAQYVGAFAPKQINHTVNVDEDDGVEKALEAERIATATERFIELADKIASAGYGSGVIGEDVVDAELVEDDTAEDWTESGDEVAPPAAVGQWVNGKFVRMLPPASAD